LSVFHGVDAIGVEEGKENVEGSDNVLVKMAAVVDDDVKSPVLCRKLAKSFGVGLIALPDVDTVLAEVSLVAEINANDVAVRKESLPHAQGFATDGGFFVAANADLDNIELPQSNRREVALIVLGVPVHSPFIGSEMGGELVEVGSIDDLGQR
jgi:hypothetical protein